MERAVVAVQSQELTEKAKDYMPRYVLKDRTTGKVVCDAQGFGFRSEEKAYAAWDYWHPLQ